MNPLLKSVLHFYLNCEFLFVEKDGSCYRDRLSYILDGFLAGIMGTEFFFDEKGKEDDGEIKLILFPKYSKNNRLKIIKESYLSLCYKKKKDKIIYAFDTPQSLKYAIENSFVMFDLIQNEVAVNFFDVKHIPMTKEGEVNNYVYSTKKMNEQTISILVEGEEYYSFFEGKAVIRYQDIVKTYIPKKVWGSFNKEFPGTPIKKVPVHPFKLLLRQRLVYWAWYAWGMLVMYLIMKFC